MRNIKIGLKYKMLIITSITGVLMIFALSWITTSITGNLIRAEISQRFADQAQQINNEIDIFMDNLSQNILALSVDHNVELFFKGISNDTEGYDTIKNLSRVLMTLRTNALYTDVYLFSTTTGRLISSDIDNCSGNYLEYGVEKTSWYKKLMNSKEIMKVLTDYVPPVVTSKPRFALTLKCNSFPQNEYNGFIVYSVKYEYINNILKNTSYNNNQYFDAIITDNYGNIIYQSNADNFLGHNDINSSIIEGLINDDKKIIDNINEKFIYKINKSQRNDWNVICIASKQTVFANENHIYTIIVITAVALGILMITAFFIMANRFVNPIIKLKYLMQVAEQKGYKVQSEIRGSDEVAELGLCFNNMVKNVLENQVLRSEAQYQALQQQINPHFLHNTLQAIRTMAKKQGCDDIRKTVEQLSQMFRYSLNLNTKRMVLLSEELEHVKNYLGIMELRFGGRFSWRIDVPEVYLNVEMPFFVLQPLVENALSHGLHDNDNGLVKISCEAINDYLIIKISDDGKGMCAEKLKALDDYINEREVQSQTYSFTGIALKNINARVKLIYNKNCGLEIYSKENIGTTVYIKLTNEALE